MPFPHPARIAAILLAAILLVAAAAPSPASAEADDHSRAREALRAGRILPLEQIVAKAKADFGGEVLDVELEDERAGLRYELKLMAADGRILKLEYDAATGALVHVKGRNKRHNEEQR